MQSSILILLPLLQARVGRRLCLARALRLLSRGSVSSVAVSDDLILDGRL